MDSSIRAAADAVVAALDARPALPDLVALGEPTHDEPASLALWSEVLDRLIERGARSVALETDAVAALVLDVWVRGGPGSLDDVLDAGLSHGFGRRPGMRELVAGLRVRNDEVAPAARVAVHGFDLPTEAEGAPSPRPHLEHLRAYLVAGLDEDAAAVSADALDRLLGPDEPWATWAAQVDATMSVGASEGAIALRAVADDLVVTLHAEAPRLVEATSREAWHVAERHGRAALGLLRYHAAAARTGRTPGERVSRMMGVRDAEMARALLAIRAEERHRGPTAVLAHDGHLQLERSTWDPGDPERAWSWASAGAIVAAVGPEEYLHVAGASGGSDPGTPAPDPSEREVAALLLALPGVTHLRADEAQGAPAVAHGHWFFYARPADRMPFATVVTSDYPGHDESSRLDRAGVFRVNLAVGREALTDAVGVGPAAWDGLDPAALDRVLPHPVYGSQGWLAVLCPGAARLPEIERLARIALVRARRGDVNP